MYPQEISAVEEIFLYLSTVTPTTTGRSLLSPYHAEALISILDRWPQTQLFPVIDLSRLFAGFCADVFQSAESRVSFVRALSKACDFTGTSLEGATGKARETNVLLTLRALANLIANTPDWEGTKLVFDEVS